MITTANVIFPAFFFPYIATVTYPLSGLGALTVEVFTFRRFYHFNSILWAVGIVLLANLTSSLAGVGLAFLLPSGLNPEFVRTGHGSAFGPRWNTYAAISWPMLCILSILIEYSVLYGLTRKHNCKHLLRVTIIANVSSYILLYIIFQASVYAAWHKFSRARHCWYNSSVA